MIQIQMVPSIVFTDMENPANKWTRNFAPVMTHEAIQEEINAVSDLCNNDSGTCGCCCVNRTHSWKSFAKDFFLPVFVNNVLKIKSVVGKIIAALFAIPFDIATFPLRLVFLPMSIWLNKTNYERKPIVQYLMQQGASKEILAADKLVVEFGENDPSQPNNLLLWTAKNVHLRNVPCCEGGNKKINNANEPLTPDEIRNFER